MTLLPFTPGDRPRWKGKTVVVIAVHGSAVAIRGVDGIDRIVPIETLQASQKRPEQASSPKGAA